MTDAHNSPVTTTDDDDVTAVITGDFDMPATFTTEPALEEALARPGLRSFTLDLTGLTFIDSLGLGVVIRLAAALETRGIPLRILPGPPAGPTGLHDGRTGSRAAVRAGTVSIAGSRWR